MSTDTHVATINGDRHMYLSERFRSYEEQIHHELSLLDGSKYFAWSLWRAPEGVGLFDIDKEKFPVEFMQSAGSADAMTIEVRFVEDDGVARQYIVGRPGHKSTGEPPLTVTYLNNTRELHLFPNEVFTADEAAHVYHQYFLTDRVPEPYVLRQMSGAEG